MSAASGSRRQLEATIARQLSLVWAQAAAAAQMPPPADALDGAVRAAVRERVITEAAAAIMRAQATRLERAAAERTGRRP